MCYGKGSDRYCKRVRKMFGRILRENHILHRDSKHEGVNGEGARMTLGIYSDWRNVGGLSVYDFKILGEINQERIFGKH